MSIDIASASADEIIAWARSLNWPHRALPAVVEKLEDLDAKRKPYEGRKDLTASHQRAFDKLRAESQKLSAVLPELEEERDAIGNSRKQLHGGSRISVGTEAKTYRPDKPEHSFIRDLFSAGKGDQEAGERLRRNRMEALDALGYEYRDMSVTAGQGGEFVPPLYLAAEWVAPSIASRPFADAIPSSPLPPTGMVISIPQLSSGVTVDVRADLGTVSETDGVTGTIQHDVRELSGQVDIGRQDLMRSEPGLDEVITRTLLRRYASKLDSQLLNGTGSANQHLGIRAVSGINSISYTDGTPTGAELLPKLSNAIEQIASNRNGEVFADMIVMAPRRAAWLAKELSSTFPLFQVGQLNQAVGTSSGGFAGSLLGLRILLDANVGVAYGASTSEDECYIVASEDMHLLESPVQVRVFEDVLSGIGAVRIQVFGFSAFLSKRYPASISKVAGTGLIAPTW